MNVDRRMSVRLASGKTTKGVVCGWRCQTGLRRQQRESLTKRPPRTNVTNALSCSGIPRGE